MSLCQDTRQAIPWITGVTQYLLCGAAPSLPHTPNMRSSPRVDDGTSTEILNWANAHTLLLPLRRLLCSLTARACVFERPRQSEREAGACRGSSEEGLIENTRWAQWSVCRAIRRAIILMQIIYTDNSAAGRRARTVGCQSSLNHRGHDIVWGWLFTISQGSRFSYDIAISPYRFKPWKEPSPARRPSHNET